MPVTWRPALAVGDAMIDGDHRHLLDLVNAYEAALNDGDPSDIETVFLELGSYAKAHFQREIALQRRIGFPEADAHAALHEAMLQDLKRLHVAFGRADDRAAVVGETARLLRRWVLNHIIGEDLKMRPYLEAKRQTA